MEKDITHLIEKYISGERMSPDEIQFVESKLNNDPQLAQKVMDQLEEPILSSDVLIGIQQWGKRRMKKDLNKIEKELKEEGFFINDEMIMQYHQGNLEGEMLEIFETRLARDEVFATEVDHQKDILEGVKIFGKKELRKDLSQVQEELAAEGFFDDKKESEPIESKVININYRKIFAYAASITILISVSIWFFNQNDSLDTAFTNYYQLYEDRTLEMEAKDELESLGMGGIDDDERLKSLLTCLDLYYKSDNKNLQDTVDSAFQTHLQKYPTDNNVKFYQALFWMNINQFERVEANLIQLQSLSNFRFKKEVDWYLALSYLKSSKLDQSKELLRKIVSDKDSPYHQESKELLDSL